MRRIINLNYLLSSVFFAGLLISCSSEVKEKNTNEKKNENKKEIVKKDPIEIEIKVKTTNPEDLEIFEDGIIPWISLSDPEKDFPNLIDADKIVVSSQEVSVLIDYPLDIPEIIHLKTDNEEGFTLKELITGISREYKRIYAEEEESATEKTVPIEQRKGLVNRNSTNGKYGICCHDLIELDLSAIIIYFENEIPEIELYIES